MNGSPTGVSFLKLKEEADAQPGAIKRNHQTIGIENSSTGN
jgi:hypothetical protein